jgi:hypothetical protein
MFATRQKLALFHLAGTQFGRLIIHQQASRWRFAQGRVLALFRVSLVQVAQLSAGLAGASQLSLRGGSAALKRGGSFLSSCSRLCAHELLWLSRLPAHLDRPAG